MDSKDSSKLTLSKGQFKEERFGFWLWLFLATISVLTLLKTQDLIQKTVERSGKTYRLCQVTNRELSLFLWENPQFMKANVSSKQAYLPGFQYLNSSSPYKEHMDEWVEVPPYLFFHYQTWKRLIGREYQKRVIPVQDFKKFISKEKIWIPQNWSEAPKGYVELLKGLTLLSDETNLEALPLEDLPIEVKQAFNGWRNLFLEGEEINQFSPTFLDLKGFLKENPGYLRPLWRNLVIESDPHYLKTITYGSPRDDEIVPKNELSPFLRVALFNFVKAKQGL